MQLLKAQQALQKELQNTKMFFRHFHSEYMYCFYTAIWTAIGQKNILRFGNSSANIVLHSKAAKTPSCWKCCCQQQAETIKFLARGGPIEHFGPEFCVEISPPSQASSLAHFVAGNSVSSKMVFLQLSKANETLQKELQNTKSFFDQFLYHNTIRS